MPAVRPDARRVTGSYLQPLLEAAAARGVSARDLAQAACLPSELLGTLPDTISANDYVHLLAVGAELADDPHFGLHVGERVKLGTYSVYGLILLSCRDFGQVFQQTMRYEQLAHDLGRSELALDGNNAQYHWLTNYPQANRHLVESVFAGIRVFSTWLAGMALPSSKMQFMHAQQSDDAEFLRVFGALPLFGQPVNAAHFPAQLLAWPVPNADVGRATAARARAQRRRHRRPGACGHHQEPGP